MPHYVAGLPDRLAEEKKTCISDHSQVQNGLARIVKSSSLLNKRYLSTYLPFLLTMIVHRYKIGFEYPGWEMLSERDNKVLGEGL